MKHFSSFVLAVVCCISVHFSQAQVLGNSCPGCVVNTALFPTPGDFDYGLKPDTLVVTRGDTVDLDVSYLLPKKINVSPLGIVDIQSVQIVSFSNNPIGLKFTTSNPTTNTFYPQTNRFACVKVCGRTFEQPGVRIITITVQGCVSAGCQNQDVTVPMKILPGATTAGNDCFNKPFAYSCGPDSASFVVKATAPCILDATLNPCKFKWNFGNGFIDSSLNPAPVHFNTVGTHYVKLRKYRMKYVITNVSATDYAGSSGNWWCGDIEEPNYPLLGCTGKPDMYGNLVCGSQNSLPEKTDQSTATWSGLNIEMTSNLISISIKDKDNVSNDDDAGSAALNITAPGVFHLSNNCCNP